MELLNHIFEMGLIYVPVVIGVYITSRLIKLDDLTLEGSFNLGGALGAFLLIHGCPCSIACICVVLAGALAGFISGFLHTRLGINHLISGLAMTAALYSISLKLVNAHCVLDPSSSFFAQSSLLIDSPWNKLVILLAISLSLIFTLHRLLKSEIGLLLKAVGCNKRLLTSLGKDPSHYQMFGLSLANALSAFSGMLFVQWLGFYSITNYIGTWIAGLNGLMIAELMPSPLKWGLLTGSILNQTLFAAVIELQIDPVWNQALKAVLVIALLRFASLNSKKRKSSHVASS